MIVIDVFGDDDQSVLDERAKKLKDEQDKIERMKRLYEEELRRVPRPQLQIIELLQSIYRCKMCKPSSNVSI